MQTIPVVLSDGQLIKIQVSPGSREEDVAFRPVSLHGLAKAVQGIAEEIMQSLQRTRPDKTTVEFGVEVALESGELTAVVLKGSATGNFKITLEWGRDSGGGPLSPGSGSESL